MNDDSMALAERLCRRVPGLRALVLFGSTLSPATRRPTSIPDLLAIVDDLGAALPAFDLAWPAPVARWLGRPLPPVTCALRDPGWAPPLAKVNVVTFDAAHAVLRRPDDLSLAGRLAKKTCLLWTRDAGARADTEALLDRAVEVMAGTTTLGLPRVITLASASRRCFALSYRAEPRPERAAQIAVRYRAFAADLVARYGPRLAAAARARGIDVVPGGLIDRRPSSVRRRDARALARLLVRSHARTLLRWTRQALVYRGWLSYVAGKLRRAWSAAPPRDPPSPPRREAAPAVASPVSPSGGGPRRSNRVSFAAGGDHDARAPRKAE